MLNHLVIVSDTVRVKGEDTRVIKAGTIELKDVASAAKLSALINEACGGISGGLSAETAVRVLLPRGSVILREQEMEAVAEAWDELRGTSNATFRKAGV